jgi:hypothetical protein
MLRTRTAIVILGVLTAAMLIYVGVTHPYYLPERGGGSLAKNRNLNSAAVMLVHSWYDEKCCHGRTVIRSRVKKSRKSATAGFGMTWRPNNATGFRTIT